MKTPCVQVKNANAFTLDIEKDSELFYASLLRPLSGIHSPSYTYWKQAQTPVAFALGCSEANVPR
jgi:hypothetical protein